MTRLPHKAVKTSIRDFNRTSVLFVVYIYVSPEGGALTSS